MGDEGGARDPVEQARRWLGHRAPPVPAPVTRESRPPGAKAEAGTVEGLGPHNGDGADGTGVDGTGVDGTGVDGTGVDGDADPEAVARAVVLRKLVAQARTRSELSRSLQAKNVPTDAAEAVLDRFTDLGLIDDSQFAQDWVESRQRRRHLSRGALRRELNAKGVAREEIEAALADVDPQAELETARELARKKVRTLTGADAVVRDRRVAGVLTRRGFSTAVVATVLGEIRRSD